MRRSVNRHDDNYANNNNGENEGNDYKKSNHHVQCTYEAWKDQVYSTQNNSNHNQKANADNNACREDYHP